MSNYTPLNDNDDNVDEAFQIAKNKIQTAVHEFISKFERWNKTLETTNTAASPEFSNLTEALKQDYKDIKKALKEMEKSIEYVKKTPRLGISATEIKSRQDFVDSMLQTIKDYQQKITSDRTKQTLERHKNSLQINPNHSNNQDAIQKANNYVNQRYIDDQKMQMHEERKRQDETLDDMKETLKRLGAIGHAITAEIDEQNVILDDINDGMDTARDRIAHLTEKMDALMNHSQNKKICVIIILVIILVVMIYFMF